MTPMDFVGQLQAHWIGGFAVLVAAFTAWAAPGKTTAGPVFSGLANASAAVAVLEDRFAVACDEENIIRVYSCSKPGPPVASFDFGRFLKVKSLPDETDLEGAARVGDRVYWTGSHNRGKEPRSVFSRACLFATEIRRAGDRLELVPVGQPYRQLREDILADPRLRDGKLGAAVGKARNKPGALDIEGLAATPEGRLLIGFRTPLRRAEALILPIENPDGIIRGERAKLGELLSVDLGGLGIRDFAKVASGYLIAAGPTDSKGKFRLYQWGGPGTAAEAWPGIEFADVHPEAIVPFRAGGAVRCLLLSDDGNAQGAGKGPKRFRSVWVED